MEQAAAMMGRKDGKRFCRHSRTGGRRKVWVHWCTKRQFVVLSTKEI